MTGTSVSIQTSSVEIVCQALLEPKNPNQLDQFLRRVFSFEDIVSVVIDPSSGRFVLNLNPRLKARHTLLLSLSERLISPATADTEEASVPYFELPMKGVSRAFAHAPPKLVGVSRLLYQGAGYFFLGLSFIGAATPFIPTTPFVLLTSYFFIRSSPELNQRLLKNRFSGPMLTDWYLYHAIRRSRRRNLLLVIATVFSSTILLTRASAPTLQIMLLASLTSITIVLLIPVKNDPENPRDLNLLSRLSFLKILGKPHRPLLTASP
jgi:uncharacterized membrane protein YbaN (DUF454 family)